MSGAQQKSEPFKIGDKVWYGTSIYSIDKFRGKDDRISEISNDTTAIDVWTKDLTPIKVAPTVAKKEEEEKLLIPREGWLDIYDDTEGLPLDFWSNNEDTGKNELYCDCVLPNLKCMPRL
jgi:hypothetical protein